MVFLAMAIVYLLVLRRQWLLGHLQAVLGVAVALGLIGAVFPLADRLVSKSSIESEGDRLKLQNDIRSTIFQAIAGLAVFVGVFVAWQQIQSDRSQSQATNTLASQEQVAQAYGQAVSELGSHQKDVRIGGMYALEEISKRARILTSHQLILS